MHRTSRIGRSVGGVKSPNSRNHRRTTENRSGTGTSRPKRSGSLLFSTSIFFEASLARSRQCSWASSAPVRAGAVTMARHPGFGGGRERVLPRMLRIRQRFDAPRLDDAAGAIVRGVRALGLARRATPGASVALGCSSRGISGYPSLVRATVNALRELGLEPFLFPAMGSHGAASAAGQVDVLARLGVDAQSVGAPIAPRLVRSCLGCRGWQ